MTSLAQHPEVRARPAHASVGVEWAIGGASGRPARVLRWTILLDEGRAAASLIDASGVHPLRELGADELRITRDEALGLLHADAPPLLALTLTHRDGALEPLFARTSLLAMLEIPGGRYDVRAQPPPPAAGPPREPMNDR